MWDQLVDRGIWVLIAAVAGIFLFYLLHRWAPKIAAKIIPNQWQKQMKDSQKLVSRSITAIGSLIIALGMAAFIIPRYGVSITPALNAVGGWLIERGITILIIILIAYLAHKIASVLTPMLVRRSITVKGRGRRAKEELEKRAHTLSGFLTTALSLVILIIALFMILSEIGIDITPLLAGAGIAGIAIGFGAQSLIKDFVNGVFIISEDQYDKGDVVKIAGVIGLVEEINLRRTIMRDLDGIVHSIPNGEITTASNYTRDWSRVNLDISVAYGTDLDHAIRVINRVGQELAEDEVWNSQIKSVPQVLRVNNLGDSGIEIKILGDVKPMQQWAVMGELRLRLKKAFDEEGIEIPWPHLKLYFGQNQTEKGLTCQACSHVNLPHSKFCANCGAGLNP